MTNVPWIMEAAVNDVSTVMAAINVVAMLDTLCPTIITTVKVTDHNVNVI
jgi:hypothetical protein